MMFSRGEGSGMTQRMKGARIGQLSILCAALLMVLAAPPATSAANPGPCRVRNVTQHTSGQSLARMVERAEDGDRLRVRGSCSGGVTIGNDITLIGVDDARITRSAGVGAVLRVEPRTQVLVIGVSIRGGRDVGIANEGTLTLVDAIVAGNGTPILGDPPPGGNGSDGGVLNRGRATLVDTVVRANVASYKRGGGITSAGRLTLRRTRVAANSTPHDAGGGIFVRRGRATLRDTTVVSNEAGLGGAGSPPREPLPSRSPAPTSAGIPPTVGAAASTSAPRARSRSPIRPSLTTVRGPMAGVAFTSTAPPPPPCGAARCPATAQGIGAGASRTMVNSGSWSPR